MQTPSPTVRVEGHDGWAVVHIQREHKRNALDRATRAALLHAFRSLEGDARAIVLTGQGASFCAGLDLKEREAETAGGAPDTAGNEWVELNAAMRAHPAAFIAAVNGLALGGGVTPFSVARNSASQPTPARRGPRPSSRAFHASGWPGCSSRSSASAPPPSNSGG
jgi:enoyl-CoA hydratase/carnithine racemase